MYDAGAARPPQWFLPLFRVGFTPHCRVAVVVAVMLSSPLWCGCGRGNGFIHPHWVVVMLWLWLIEVSSTPCGVAVVLVMVLVMVMRLQGHVEVLGARHLGKKGDNAMRYTSDNRCQDRDDYDPGDGWYFCPAKTGQGAKSGDSCEDGGFQPSKTTTVTRMPTSKGSIPVTVGTSEALWQGWYTYLFLLY